MSSEEVSRMDREEKRRRLAELLGKRAARPRRIPLSFAQERLWFLDRLHPGDTSYHLATVLSVRGPLRPTVLAASLGEVVRRHESLRTTFTDEGGQAAQIVSREVRFDLIEADLRGLPATKRELEARRLISAVLATPFDLGRGPLLRLTLARLTDDRWALLLVQHHIVSDGWSLAVLLSELVTLYGALAAGRSSPLPEPPLQYADYAAWQRDLLRGEALAARLDHWRERLAGASALELPGDRPRPPVQTTRGAAVPFRFPPELREKLAERAQSEGATLFMVELAVFQTLLARHTGREDICVGSPIANRQRPELRGVIGLFANTLVLRTRLHGDPTFREALARVRSGVVAAFEHQDLPFEKLVEALRPERDPSRTPLFQIAFAPQEAPAAELASPGLEISPFAAGLGTAKFDLTVEIGDGPQGLQGRFEYNRDLFDRTTIERLTAGFERLLEAAAAAPESRLSELPLLSPAERAQALWEWNDTGSAEGLDGRAIHQIFEEVAARFPEAVAVEIGDERVTYRDLEARANRLARHLRGLGVTQETLVGIALERSVRLVNAQLGILKAGGAYVPLDPAYPRERLRLMLEEVRLPLILAEERLLSSLPGAEPESRILRLDREAEALARQSPEPLASMAGPDHLAYVMFTSGSTGRPRAVGVKHHGVVRLVRGTRFARFGAEQVFLQLASPSFDAATLEIWGSLLHGGRLVLFPGAVPSLADLDRCLARHGVTSLWLTAGLFHEVVKHRIESLRPVRQLLAGGDVLSPTHVNRLLETLPDCTLINGYGPTENTTFTCCHTVSRPVPPGRSVPIGHPIANTTVYLLDRHLQPVPPGAPGELFTGGAGLARGYLGRPDLTAERFIPHPFSAEPGARLYRTGDLVRRLADGGALEFLGRLDQQVKIRGFRVEPGEIEAALAGCPGVREAAVLVLAGEAGERSLAACLVPTEGETPAIEGVRAFLAAKLPPYMIPAQVVFVPSFPLTEHGKIDRRALAARVETAAPQRAAWTLLASELERTIAAAWRQVLGVEEVGRDENFFDLGGHSLRMIELHALLQKSLEREIAIVELFQYPTVGSFARYLERGAHESEAIEEARRRAAGAVAGERPGRPAFAVIGMAGRFPGAPDVDTLWAHLRDGVESIRSFTDEELLAAGVPAERLASPHYVKAGAPLAGIELFDADFFGFTPREAEVLDPQQRLFLECAWEALENAGYDPSRERRPVGVYAGAFLCSYTWNVANHPEIVELMGPMAVQASLAPDFLATRVSYKLGLRGPSVSVQTACSTSLVALHFACQALLLGECDLALAGGVTVRLPQPSGYTFLEGDIASPDGHCRAFDAQARGTVGGNGVAVAVLKRLDDALRDGDTIDAVVRGTAINNDGGLKVGYTAPSVEGQAEVIAAAQAAAGVAPETITYVEAHGTGTTLGDPIEVAALNRVFGPGRPRSCALGSIKTNIGHLDAAAGIAGFLKTVLALKHRQIPPSLHFQELNPRIDFAAGPFYVNNRLAGWESDGAPRRAGVSSFGIGGTNAHAILEEAPPLEPSGPSRPRQLLLLSARTPAALEGATAGLARALRRSEPAPPPLADVAFTLQNGRRAFAHRRALVCGSVEEALDALEGRAPERLLTSHAPQERRPVAFLFPGQGAQHVDMGRDLYGSEPVFRREVDAGAEALAARLGRDLRELLYPTAAQRQEAERELRETRYAQPALFVLEHALARLWMSWGFHPAAMIGHSLGEYVAACLAGVFSFEDALALVAVRGERMQALPSGSMLSVDLPEAGLLEAVAAFPELSLAAVNGPSLGTVSGPEPAVAALEVVLAAWGVSHRRLHTSHAFHSPMMDPVIAPFAEEVARTGRHPPSIPCLSNLTGSWLTGAEATDPEYWTRHLRAPVRFSEGLARLLSYTLPAAPPVLLEVGPGRTLSSLVRQQGAAGAAPAAIPSMRHPNDGEPDDAVLLKALGRLWLAGVEVDWPALSAGERRRRVPLPTYPFERRRFWLDAPHHLLLARPAGEAAKVPERPDPETGDRGPTELLAKPRRPDLSVSYREPQSAIERRIAAVWEDLLGIGGIGVHDDFFELGGHSLLATRLVARLCAALGREIPLETFFAGPTIARIAARIETDMIAGPEVPAATRVPRDGDLPLSFAQQQIWILQSLEPWSPAYNLSGTLLLKGELQAGAAIRSLREIVARHEVLRTTFPATGGPPVQRIAPRDGGAVSWIDLGALDRERCLAETRSLAERSALQLFDLASEPPARLGLVRLAEDEHALLLVFHHIAFDGWSWGAFYAELAALYEAFSTGRPSPLPPLAIQYADFTVWQRRRLSGESLEAHLGYWRERLAGASPLGLSAAPSGEPGSFAGAVEPFSLPAGLSQALEALGRQEGCTPFMTLLALFAVLLHQRSGREDITLGTPVAGRLLPETEPLIGNFINTLVLRIDLFGNPGFRECLARSREALLGAHAHQEIPYEQVVSALRREGILGRAPLFDLWFVVHDTPIPSLALPQLSIEPLEAGLGAARHDLSLSLWPGLQGLAGTFVYRTTCFKPAAVRRMIEDFATLARKVIDDRDLRLETLARLLAEADRRQSQEQKRALKTVGLDRLKTARRKAV